MVMMKDDMKTHVTGDHAKLAKPDKDVIRHVNVEKRKANQSAIYANNVNKREEAVQDTSSKQKSGAPRPAFKFLTQF